MNSKRLPNKVLKKIYNKTMLERVVDRLKNSKKISKIIIATSTLKSDDKIESFCKTKNIRCFRGSINNVYYRFVKIIKNLNIDNFIRVSGDSPLIDYKIIDKAINIFLKKKPDIVTNTFPKSFPKGQSVEVLNSNLFLKFFKKIKKNSHKEHITKYFYDNFKNFNIVNFSLNQNLNNLNVSINTKSDFEFVKKIIKKTNNRNVRLKKILMVYKKIKQ